LDVIPDRKYIEAIESHQAKFDTDVLKEMLKEVGLTTKDERVYKMISVLMEEKLCSIITEVQAMQAQSQPAKEPSSLQAKIQYVKHEN
jgi:ribosomal protein L12E/L44/L45/RPP1/RPP2